jgi:predicted amidohydrolase
VGGKILRVAGGTKILIRPAAIVLRDGRDHWLVRKRGREQGVAHVFGHLAGYQGVIVLRDEQELIATAPADHWGRLTNWRPQDRPVTSQL